jgi:ribosomal protein S12 methylthiotransferase
MISLGCVKNLVDAEIMLGTLVKEGMELTNQAEEADVLIVNTCSFIDSAQEESVDTILQSAELREAHNRGQGLVVAGCLTQRFREELPKLLPEVDAFMGIDQVAQVGDIIRQARSRRVARVATKRTIRPRRGAAEISGQLGRAESGRPEEEKHEENGVRPSAVAASSGDPILHVHARPRYVPDVSTPRFRLTPAHYTYLKIAEGCNHPCSFCIIPQMRGSHRSRAQTDVVADASQLIASGVKELNLISQDTTYYGLDLRPTRTGSIAAPDRFAAAARALPRDATTLCTLLRELNGLPGEFWVRLLYTHPAHWTDELIGTIARCEKVARYIDIPLQHIHGNMLERMRRETSQEYIVDLLARLRAGLPGVTLRTTFIVGFPGETDDYFQTLLQFVAAVRFERLGVFTYSREDGTRAGKMSGQVPDEIKEERRQQVMALQQRISGEIAQKAQGQVRKVLIEGVAGAKHLRAAQIKSWEHSHAPNGRGQAGPAERYLIARGAGDAPDIDGRVFVRGRVPVGEFATVRIIGHTDYDLIAEPV